MSAVAGASSTRGDRASQPRPGVGKAGSTFRRRLKLLDVHHMVTEEPPPIKWRIDGLAVDGALTMLAGREGLGKSMLALALASAVTRGNEVAGFSCRRGRALVVDVENGEYEAHRRIHNLRPDADNLFYCVDPLDLSRELDLLEETCEDVRPNLIVLDSFRPLVPGTVENDSELDAVLTPLRNLIRASGAACILLHHVPKKGGEYRGSSAIGAAVELGFTLTKNGEADPRLRLECWKSRPAPRLTARGLEIRQRSDGSPEIISADAPAAADVISQDRVSELIVALASGPKRRAELAEALGEPRDRPGGGFQRALNMAVAGGLVVKPKRGVYALAEVTL